MLYLRKLVQYFKGDNKLMIHNHRANCIYNGTVKDFIEEHKDEYLWYCSIQEMFTDNDILVIYLNQ